MDNNTAAATRSFAVQGTTEGTRRRYVMGVVEDTLAVGPLTFLFRVRLLPRDAQIMRSETALIRVRRSEVADDHDAMTAMLASDAAQSPAFADNIADLTAIRDAAARALALPLT